MDLRTAAWLAYDRARDTAAGRGERAFLQQLAEAVRRRTGRDIASCARAAELVHSELREQGRPRTQRAPLSTVSPEA